MRDGCNNYHPCLKGYQDLSLYSRHLHISKFIFDVKIRCMHSDQLLLRVCTDGKASGLLPKCVLPKSKITSCDGQVCCLLLCFSKLCFLHSPSICIDVISKVQIYVEESRARQMQVSYNQVMPMG